MDGLSEGLRQNLEVGFLVLVIDLIITVILLPFVLRRSESTRWRPMRQQILNGLLDCQWKTLNALAADFRSIFALFLSQHIIAREGWEVQEPADVRADLMGAHRELREEVDLLAPAIEPAMAGAIINLMRLPTKVSEHLSKIDEYLVDHLHYDESRGELIRVTGKFRDSVNTDIMTILQELRNAGKELGAVIDQSSLDRRQRDALKLRLFAAIDRHGEVMYAAGGLMQLLTHRIFTYFENRQYETIDAWLRAHRPPPDQAAAILEFGDEEVVAAYHSWMAEMGEQLAA